jgi:hypothetical protein
MRVKRLIGSILVTLGIVWLLESFNFIQVDLTLVIIASFIYILYFLSGNRIKNRNIGLLTAGSIVLMLGIHNILDDIFYLGQFDGVIFFLLIGTAFLTVYLLHAKYLAQGINWPLYVGFSLYSFAGFILITEFFNQGLFKFIWALGLIGVGFYIILKGNR